MALVGLRQAVNDHLEALSDLNPESVAKLDGILRSYGIITLSEMRRRRWGAYKRILKRKTIKSDTEFYLIQGILSDLESGISSEERELLDRLVGNYEPCR